MATYRQVLNAFALKNLAKMPSIPDYHLMMGAAEELAPVPLLLYESTLVSPEVIKGMQIAENVSNGDIESAIANGTLEVNDFNINIATLGIDGGW